MNNKIKSDEEIILDQTIELVSKIYSNTELEFDMLMSHELIDNLRSISVQVETILTYLERKKVSAILKNTISNNKICENCNGNKLIQFCKSCEDNNFAEYMQKL